MLPNLPFLVIRLAGSSPAKGVAGRIGFRALMLILGLLLAAANASAACGSQQKSESSPLGWSPRLTIDNDLLAGSDANYSHGFRLSAGSSALSGFDDGRLPASLQSINVLLSRLLATASSNCNAGYTQLLTLGQAIYTPEDKEAEALVPDQRPYAGWLYGGLSLQQRSGDYLQRITLNLGMVGPAALGNQSQDLIHKIGPWSEFQGWDNQLNNEPGLQLLWEGARKWQGTATAGWGSDAVAHYGVSLGNVATFAHMGGEWRYGWRLSDDFGSLRLRPGSDTPMTDGNGTLLATQRRSVHLFLALDGRWVLRDIFLDGNTFTDSHKVDKKPLVADLAFGVALEWGELALSLARIQRTREFRQHHASQGFGSLAIHWRRWF